MPLVPVLAQMEQEGVRLDSSALADFSVQLGEEIGSIQKQIWEMAGSSFNIQSPKQLGEVLMKS
jgi:DNA polymerase-1